MFVCHTLCRKSINDQLLESFIRFSIAASSISQLGCGFVVFLVGMGFPTNAASNSAIFDCPVVCFLSLMFHSLYYT